jgi:epoxyqueuosine reductase
MNDQTSLTQAVKAEARRLGFELVGVTTPDPSAGYPRYQRWLEADLHGEMGYLASERARQRRADPRRILPECRSILVLGMRHTKAPATSPSDLQGRVAAYAWGEDYHRVFEERMGVLVGFIEAQVGEVITHRSYSDTGPILERELAQRAGLGWFGKNSMLINPGRGSYYLLGEILLGIELAPDSPFASDHCGNCTRCLQACPTDCILPDRTIDARRCISYLTIELKGAIPAKLRPMTGDWVFGCDVCQQVCPWNQRFAPTDGDPALAPRHDLPEVDLRAELALTPEAFSAKFRGSPVKRAKRRGYLRNVAVALGNSRNPEAIPALAKALLHEAEPLVRAHAAWALGQIGGETATEALKEAETNEGDEEVLSEIRAALQSRAAK